MFNKLKEKLKANWNLMRVIRLGLSILLLIEAWKSSDILFALIGLVLLFQVAFNISCCKVAGCDINHPKKRAKSGTKHTEDTTFEEVN